MAQDGAAGLAHDMEVRRNGKAKDEDIGYDTGKPVEKYISVQYAFWYWHSFWRLCSI